MCVAEYYVCCSVMLQSVAEYSVCCRVLCVLQCDVYGVRQSHVTECYIKSIACHSTLYKVNRGVLLLALSLSFTMYDLTS